jgi:hypothetical protein
MNIYVYLVYENYRCYRDYNKFHEIGITANQVKIKEKYIEKEHYKLEFFSVPAEYVERVYRYIQEKFVKSLFPIFVRSGELQSFCSDFITKCNNLQQEKALTLTTHATPLLLTLPPPPPAPLLINAGTSHAPSTKMIVLIKNKENEDVTVISSNPSTSFMAFYHQITQQPTLQVLQSICMDAKEVEEITRGFYVHFGPHKSSSQHFSLP